MPVTLADLVNTYRWTNDSEAYRLVRAACARGSALPDERVEVTAAMLDRYLERPRDGAFVSSTALRALERRIGEHGVRVRGATPRWQRDADSDGDRVITLAEIEAFYAGTTPPSLAYGHAHLTDQRAAMIRHAVAELTHERDDMDVRGSPSAELERDYFDVHWDATLRQPHVVSYRLTEADLHTRPDVDRKAVERFYADPELLASDRSAHTHESVLPAWYATRHSPIIDAATGRPQRVDQGHQMPFNDYADEEAARQSFNMVNMAGQSWVLNEQPWRLYEDAVHSLVAAIPGAVATIYVGNVYLAPDGLPQTEEGRFDAAGALVPGSRLRWYGPGRDRRPGDPGYGEERFAIPTACVRVTLLRLPDGTVSAFAIRMRNDWDLPTRAADIQRFIPGECAISVDEAEALLGVDVALPDGRRLSAEARRDGVLRALPYVRGELSDDDRAVLGIATSRS